MIRENSLLNKMTLSERVEVGLQCEAELRNRPAGSVKGRIESIVADFINFGNYQTYRQAKKIKLRGIPELVLAMDLRKFKIFPLSCIADYSSEEQLYLLSLNLPQIKAWINAHPVIKSVGHQTHDCTDCLKLISIKNVWTFLQMQFIHLKPNESF